MALSNILLAHTDFKNIQGIRKRPTPAIREEKEGAIIFKAVQNDGRPQSMKFLTGLKCVIQKQLPKMPREYISRLVYDR